MNQRVLIGAFTDEAVLILGDSRGTGTAIVRRFVTDGANVRFTYAGSRDAAKRLTQETGATAVFTDNADRDAIIDVVRKSSVLDVLVVNAGTGVFGETLELNADDIDRLFKISTHAPYHASVEATRQMPEDGRILIIGSVSGDRMSVAGMAAYVASESALQGMAHRLARDFGPRRITINVVQPGPIDTDTNPTDGPMHDMLHSLVVTKRHGQPKEVAGMVTWLTGPEASFVTGAMHTINSTFGA